jgi:hypothetical protein
MTAILLVLSLVILQDLFQFKVVYPLYGYYVPPQNIAFSWKNWKSGKFQQQRDEYLGKNFSLRNDFLRLNNSLHYTLFKSTQIDWIVFGLNGQLLDKNQVNAYLGIDSVPIKDIRRKSLYLKELNDTLQKLGKQITVVIPPNKPSIYPEYIPESFGKKTTANNYENYSRTFEELGVDYIDLVKWFRHLKASGGQSLFAANGSHWNQHGGAEGFMYMMNQLNNRINPPLGNIEIKKMTYQKEHSGELDIYVTLNLLYNTVDDTCLYPEIIIHPTIAPKPKTLFVSDSFFDCWIEMGVYDLFDSTTYYFYNDRIITQERVVTSKKLTPKEALDQYDRFMIVCNESNLDELGWGFIESMYFYFYPAAPDRTLYDKWYQSEIKKTMNSIKADETWYKNIQEKAAKRHFSIDKQLYLDALWVVENETKSPGK